MDILVEEATGRVRLQEQPRKADERAEGRESFVPSGLSFEKARWPSLLLVRAQVPSSQTQPARKARGREGDGRGGQTKCSGVSVRERTGRHPRRVTVRASRARRDREEPHGGDLTGRRHGGQWEGQPAQLRHLSHAWDVGPGLVSLHTLKGNEKSAR